MVVDRSETLGPLAAVLALLALLVVPERHPPAAVAAVPDAVLELASPGNEMSWPLDGGLAFVTPSEVFRREGVWCRNYRLLPPEERAVAVEATACREAQGAWRPPAAAAAALVAGLPAD